MNYLQVNVVISNLLKLQLQNRKLNRYYTGLMRKGRSQMFALSDADVQEDADDDDDLREYRAGQLLCSYR